MDPRKAGFGLQHFSKPTKAAYAIRTVHKPKGVHITSSVSWAPRSRIVEKKNPSSSSVSASTTLQGGKGRENDVLAASSSSLVPSSYRKRRRPNSLQNSPQEARRIDGHENVEDAFAANPKGSGDIWVLSDDSVDSTRVVEITNYCITLEIDSGARVWACSVVYAPPQLHLRRAQNFALAIDHRCLMDMGPIGGILIIPPFSLGVGLILSHEEKKLQDELNLVVIQEEML
ncbi:hypothetical protein PIB30_045237 [Stylosanthes scabra]|uniref:Uncharacterized protein n=1 Tax=Stylosanthes scabra TaxID=79078 RepID=A0ABU6VHI4_9FABA|nr:hypothetical protein [Stylosanthes scabra]